MNSKEPQHPLQLIPLLNTGTSPHVCDPSHRTVLGRATDCDISLQDPAVSRKHAAFACINGMWTITDLQSKHGTKLNSVSLVPLKPATLNVGDVVRTGQSAFRISFGTSHISRRVVTDATIAPQTRVDSVLGHEMTSLSHKRLTLLIDGTARVHDAENEQELANAIVQLAMRGTGYPRAAMLRWEGNPDEVEVLASSDNSGFSTTEFSFSRSVLAALEPGHLVQLTRNTSAQPSHSIEKLGICAAMCAPLIIDQQVVGGLYMDVRDGEQSMHTDAASFCSAVAQIASVAMSSLLRVDLAKRQHELDMELQIAQETQACILPPSEGTAGSASYVSRIIPGSVVSGDIFDIFEINNNKVAICLGDVTGHGIGSALLMTAIHAQIRASFAHSDNPTDVANAVNAYVVQHSPSNRFASLWIGVFHSVTRTLEYVDAGHGHWLLMPEDGTPLCPDHTGSMIVGIVTSASFCAETLQLAPNERLVLYSDGIIEQPNNEGELFGVDRLIASLRGNTSIKEDVQHTVDTLTDFASTSIFADDTSIVSITFR